MERPQFKFDCLRGTKTNKRQICSVVMVVVVVVKRKRSTEWSIYRRQQATNNKQPQQQATNKTSNQQNKQTTTTHNNNKQPRHITQIGQLQFLLNFPADAILFGQQFNDIVSSIQCVDIYDWGH
jgi:hypothetical protein